MLKVLLVDDEILEREGIKELIPWEQLGVELAGEASNAKKALELANYVKPDIVITDIKMSGMDGIELVSRLKTFLPDINVIFISGYQDFEYAKNAIALDANGYVLKPVDEIELISVLKKAIDRCHEIMKSINEKQAINRQIEEGRPLLQQQLINNILTGEPEDEETLWEQIDRLKLDLVKGYFCVAAISLDNYRIIARNLSEYDKKSISLFISEAFKHFSLQGVSFVTVKMQEDLFALIVSCSTIYFDINSLLLSCLRNFNNEFFNTYGMTATIGQSKFIDKLNHLNELYKQAVDAIKHKWCLGKGSIIFAAQLNEGLEHFAITERKVDMGFLEIQKNVNKCIIAGDSIGVEKVIKHYFDSLSPIEKKNPEYVRTACLDLINFVDYVLVERGENLENIFGNHIAVIDELLLLETLNDTELWIIKKLSNIALYMSDKNNDPNKRVVSKIINIIENHYSQELTVEGFAQEVFLSPNYIRKIFKNETGKTLSEYIIQTRMNKAVELMREPSHKIQDIARQVGYSSTSYFGQIFKQYFGVTPGEYVNSMEGI